MYEGAKAFFDFLFYWVGVWTCANAVTMAGKAVRDRRHDETCLAYLRELRVRFRREAAEKEPDSTPAETVKAADQEP